MTGKLAAEKMLKQLPGKSTRAKARAKIEVRESRVAKAQLRPSLAARLVPDVASPKRNQQPAKNLVLRGPRAAVENREI